MAAAAAMRSSHYTSSMLTRDTLATYRSVIGYTVGGSKKSTPQIIKEELKEMMKLAIPICTTLLLENFTSLITTLFVTSLGSLQLAAVTLASTICNTTGFSLGISLLTAVDTLSSHANGAGKFKRMGVIAQRAFWIINIFSVPVVLVWLCFQPLMRLLNYDEAVISEGFRYIVLMIPGLIIALWFDVLMRFLQSMGIAAPTTVCTIVSIPFQAAFLYYFTRVWEFGIMGASFALSCVYGVQLAVLGSFVMGYRQHLRKAWPGWTLKAFQRWGPFLSLAIPGALMGSMEGWGFDILTIMTGKIGDGRTALAIHGLLQSAYFMALQIPTGISIAVNTRVAMLLGARKIKQAKIAYYIALACNVSLVSVLAASLIILANTASSILATILEAESSDLMGEVTKLLPLICGVLLADSVQISSSGALRGLGMQRFGMITNFIAFYVVGIPIGLFLAFRGNLIFKETLGLVGIWCGVAVCDAGSATLFLVVLFMVDWRKAARKIAEDAAKEAALEKKEADKKAKEQVVNDSDNKDVNEDSRSDETSSLLKQHQGNKRQFALGGAAEDAPPPAYSHGDGDEEEDIEHGDALNGGVNPAIAGLDAGGHESEAEDDVSDDDALPTATDTTSSH